MYIIPNLCKIIGHNASEYLLLLRIRHIKKLNAIYKTTKKRQKIPIETIFFYDSLFYKQNRFKYSSFLRRKGEGDIHISNMNLNHFRVESQPDPRSEE